MKINKQLISIIILIFLLISSCAYSSKTPRINAARFSPDGKYLIFSIEDEKEESIYRVHKDGSGLKKLTAVKGRNDFPIYSPDGSKIAFSSSESLRDGVPASLYIMDSDGSNLKRLTFGDQFDTFPIFSPDGKRIYFTRSFWFGRHSPVVHPFWQKEDIYSINIDGSDLKAITEERYYDISPLSIFPDGNRILTRIVIAGKSHLIWIIPLQDAKKLIPISRVPKDFLPFGIETYNPQLSSDGKDLLFIMAQAFKYDIYLMSLLDGNIRRLTNLKSYILYPSFSMDEKEIVFLLDPKRNGNHELWIVNSDGTNPHRINIDLSKIKQ